MMLKMMSATAKKRFPTANRNHGRRYSGRLRKTEHPIATAEPTPIRS
jgi:hypothetical protein